MSLFSNHVSGSVWADRRAHLILVLTALLLFVVYGVIPDESRKPEVHLGTKVISPQVLPDSGLVVSPPVGQENKLQATDVQQDNAAAAPQPVATRAWGRADSKAAYPSLPVPESVRIYEQVQLDMDKPYYPAVGEHVSLLLPGVGELTASVSASHDNPNGDYSWRGYLDGHGTDYPVVMTYGANSVFATVTTPEGSYTMESVGGNGWVYKNPAGAELSQPGKHDFLEIPLNSGHHH